jgi:hypothetical protein
MKYRMICALVLGALVLAGCGSKQDANDKNFGAAIGQFLEKKGDVCLLVVNKWPYDVSEYQMKIQKSISATTPQPMDAFVSAGLVSVSDAETDELNGNLGPNYNKPTGRKLKVTRYDLTDAGKKAYIENKFGGGSICYAKKSLDKVVKWDVPENFGGPSVTNVTYHYKLDKVADWAKQAQFQAVFPVVKQVIDGEGKLDQRQGVKLTNQGWEALGLD